MATVVAQVVPVKKDKTYLETIGQTPLVRLDRSLPDAARQARVLVKLEMANPGGSIKDRIALSMVEDLERSGKLIPGESKIMEYTSGNTGIGLAMVAAAKGYQCILIMPQLPAFRERYLICRQFGAEVHLTAPALGVKGMEQHARELEASDPTIVCTNQFTNTVNPGTHFATTGPEIWEEAGHVDYFVAGLGTAGTLTGAGKYLLSKNPNCQIICVEPTESQMHGAGAAHSPHTILGIAPGILTSFTQEAEPSYQGNVITEYAHANSAEAIEFAKLVTTMEGMMVGPSAGAALKVAMDVAARPEAAGKTIVVMLPSHGIRYTAHPLWKAAQDETAQALPAPPNMSKDELLLWTSPPTL